MSSATAKIIIIKYLLIIIIFLGNEQETSFPDLCRRISQPVHHVPAGHQQVVGWKLHLLVRHVPAAEDQRRLVQVNPFS
jgi:hypothetical protein